ncbi:YbdK family carboxylate-amine ligase [Fluoribacter dumoffii]|uniref:carboxylate-amine ligase n=1 Tax=Fluoribacter dumoffii TaxID=463 RepID=UPI00026C8203|nr:YbdK family carboxylate-amine ligase [Fluoribacter dumoffii]MCW8385469.1 YbdK family carboxylate-amine ligase [Fluoribacter dumoffii]MCW8418520.1 YbdK family carboxylate-amine ligase [Fluoribacter dumoffii]MCW8453638.1 YbdK family carboxylate-amine ligase [Fluoribacter dumoffii]MCW8459144.1 YbdK family carboxylate-amine ligase [Fluoribacter dumoffii]MCW8482503.1 YbdK family carboxylate-amine ligase [Fluoribacter dumoffii]
MDDHIKNFLKPTQSSSQSAADENEEIYFKSNGVLTLGVEIELQLIDSENYNLCSRAAEVLAATTHLEKIKPEFYLSTIEVNTDKCSTAHEVEDDLYNTLASLQLATKDLGILFSATGSHPFSRYADWVVSPTTRYQELIDRNQWLTRRMSVYGLHVHLGMSSGEDCIRFNNFFMHFLPHLLALSSSSPFWQGIDTGLASYRPTTYEALPTAGQPYHVRTWQDFENLYKTLKLCGSIKSLKDLWWDLRPSPGFGTLEIRVCDGTATLAETLALVALIHALAHWFADNGSWLESVAYPPYWLARENKWRAIRYGLDAELLMNTEGKTRLMREDINEWIEKLSPYIKKLGYQTYFSTLKVLMDSGTSSERQRKVFAYNQSLKEIVQHNVSEFLLQTPLYRRETVIA